MKQIISHIKEKSFCNFYLFCGSEEYLKKEYSNKLINAIVSENNKLMNFDFFEGKNISFQNIEQIADTLPFMNDYRLIIIKNCELFDGVKKEEGECFLKYMPKMPKTSIIIFLEEKVDKRLKFFKEFKKLATIVELDFLNENELITWISNFCKNFNKSMDNYTALHLIRTVGTNLQVINQELNKLVDFKKDETSLTKADIDEICIKSVESKIFDLINAIGNKNGSLAINIYNNLLAFKTSPFMILSMIARQFRLIVQTKFLKKENNNIAQIANILNMREFAVKECLKHGQNFSNKMLLNAINECLDVDIKIKTSQINDKLAVEMLIVKYSNSI